MLSSSELSCPEIKACNCWNYAIMQHKSANYVAFTLLSFVVLVLSLAVLLTRAAVYILVRKF